MSRARSILLLRVAVLALSVSCGPPATRGNQPAPKAEDPCTQERALLHRLAELEGAGRLVSTLEVLNARPWTCDAVAARAGALRRSVRNELGFDRDPLSQLDARALLARGLAANDPVKRQRLIDRALVSLRRRGVMDEVVVFAPNGSSPLAFGERVVVEGELWPGDGPSVVLAERGGWGAAARWFRGSAQQSPLGLRVRSTAHAWLLRNADATPVADIDHVVFSRDRSIAVGERDGQLIVFDPTSMHIHAEREIKTSWERLAIHHNRVIAGGGRTGRVGIFRLPSLEPVAVAEATPTLSSADASTIVLLGADPSASRLMNIEDGSFRKTPGIAVDMDPGLHRYLHDFSPDGRRLAFISGYQLGVLDLKSGRRFGVPLGWKSTGGRPDIFGPVFSQDGRHVCASRDGQRALIDTVSRTRLRDTPSRAVTCVHKGQRRGVVVTVSLRPGERLVRRVARMENDSVDAFEDAVVSSSGHHAAVLVERGGRVHLTGIALKTGAVTFRIDVGAADPGFMGFGNNLRAAADVVGVRIVDDERVVDLRTGANAGFPSPDAPSPTPTSPIAVRPRVAMQVAGSTLFLRNSSTVTTWDLKEARPRATIDAGCRIAISPNGEWVVTSAPCGAKGPLRIVRVASGKAHTIPSPPHTLELAVSNDGEVVTVGKPPRPSQLQASGAGSVELMHAGQLMATIFAATPRLAVAILSDGRIDFLGTPAHELPNHFACRLGDRIAAFAACADRWRSDGALANLFKAWPALQTKPRR